MDNTNSPSARSSAMNYGSGINIILGLWLIVSSWIVGYASPGMLWNNIVFGAAVVILSWIRLSVGSHPTIPSWLNALIGVWLVIAPFVYAGVSLAQKWNSVVAGVLAFIFALVSGSARVTRTA